jgi:hypothetical protein
MGSIVLLFCIDQAPSGDKVGMSVEKSKPLGSGAREFCATPTDAALSLMWSRK